MIFLVESRVSRPLFSGDGLPVSDTGLSVFFVWDSALFCFLQQAKWLDCGIDATFG